MNQESREYVRTRHGFPLALPLTAIGVIAVFTFLISRIFLAVSKEAATIIALLLAINVILAAAYLSASRRPKPPQALAAATLIVLVFAGGMVGGVVGEREFHHPNGNDNDHNGPPNGPPPGEASVEVGDNWFEPLTLTVAPGTEVEWFQTGTVPHNVVAADDSFDSHPECGRGGDCMGRGDTYRLSFDEPGTYPYYCVLHGRPGIGMHGEIIVEEP